MNINSFYYLCSLLNFAPKTTCNEKIIIQVFCKYNHKNEKGGGEEVEDREEEEEEEGNTKIW